MRLFYIVAFGIMGVLSRYYMEAQVTKTFSPPPAGTFLINVSGAFLIGVVHVLGVERTSIPPDVRVGITVGFLGGFTTFSSYCLESARLMEAGKLSTAVLYFILSPVLGLLAVALGIFCARGLFPLR